MNFPDNFLYAHRITAKWEGGFFNHPNDPGGATNYGVSLRWLKGEGIDYDFKLSFPIDHNNDGVIDILDIQALTKDQAAELFYYAFWDRQQCNQMSRAVATVVYDAGVNTGRGQSAKFLQRACNSLFNANLVADGAIGPKTMAAINSYGNQLQLANSALDFRQAFHDQLCDSSPYADGRDFRPFNNGWMNRANDVRRYIREGK